MPGSRTIHLMMMMTSTGCWKAMQPLEPLEQKGGADAADGGDRIGANVLASDRPAAQRRRHARCDVRERGTGHCVARMARAADQS